ncbi:hypothetical protein IBX65_07340 [Candidatus Aerophobetes bacterium]|nr:hypothetical protein [Candidatus Aerophobetes bacterium]
MRETDPMNAPNCKYAGDKKACEEIFLSKFDEKKFPPTIVRPVYSLGRNFLLSPFYRAGGVDLVLRLRSGRPILVPGDGTTLIQPSCAYNTGKMIATMVGQSVSIGKAYTCGHDKVMSHDDYIKLIGKVVGKEPNLVHIPSELLMSLGLKEINDGILPILTRFNLYFSVENFKNDFPDFQWELSLEDGIREFIEWNDTNGNLIETNLQTWQDKVIEIWQQCVKDFKI